MNKYYPDGFEPTDSEILDLDGTTVEVGKVRCLFNIWTGPSIGNTFGGKPLVNVKGKPMFAELAIMHRFLEAGWSSRWVEAYGARNDSPYYFSDWTDVRLKEQREDPIDDSDVENILKTVAIENGSTFSGCWDVIGWSEKNVLFAEGKRRAKDKIQGTQIKWLNAALRCGLQASQFLIVEWDFEKIFSATSK